MAPGPGEGTLSDPIQQPFCLVSGGALGASCLQVPSATCQAVLPWAGPSRDGEQALVGERWTSNAHWSPRRCRQVGPGSGRPPLATTTPLPAGKENHLKRIKSELGLRAGTPHLYNFPKTLGVE